MDKLRQDIEQLLPDGVFLMDINEDPHRGMVRCFVDSEKSISLDQTSKIVKSIAFSGHHLGIAIDIAAYTLGARCIERHFTKDRTWKGTDHSASLEPMGLKKLVRDLNATYNSLSYKKTEILDIEKIQRDKLKYRKS